VSVTKFFTYIGGKYIFFKEIIMNNFNFSAVEGNLVRDPELKETKNGKSLCKFTLGNSYSYTSRDGEQVEKANYFDITTWSKLAETCAKYLKKGSRVLVSGSLRKDVWKDNDGNYRSNIYIDSRNINFLPGKA